MFRYYYQSPASQPGNIAYDAFSVSATTFQNTSPGTLSHTPSGTPRGVVVFVVGFDTSVDEVTSVTYGGVAMSRVNIAQYTGTEPATVYGYFLGSSIPTGTQSVSVAFDTGAPDAVKIIACTTLTGVGDLTAADSAVQQGSTDVASPCTVTIDAAGGNGLGVVGMYSGNTDNTSTTPNASTTEDGYYNYTSRHAVFGHTDVTTGSVTPGWTYTNTPDDAAMVGIMVVDPGT